MKDELKKLFTGTAKEADYISMSDEITRNMKSNKFFEDFVMLTNATIIKALDDMASGAVSPGNSDMILGQLIGMRKTICRLNELRRIGKDMLDRKRSTKVESRQNGGSFMGSYMEEAFVGEMEVDPSFA